MTQKQTNKQSRLVNRRAFIGSSVGIAAGLAGCTGDGGGGGGTPTGTTSGGTASKEASDLKEEFDITEPGYEVEDELTILQWSGYWPTYFVPNFEAIFDVNVNVSFFDSNPSLINKLRSLGEGEVDLVFPTDHYSNRLATQDFFQPLDTSKIPNWGNFKPKFQNPGYEPEDDKNWTAPFNWGYTGIGNNTNVTGGELPNTWDVLWDDEFSGDITMLDGMDIFYAAFLKLGYDTINVSDQDKIDEAKELLIQQKDMLKGYNSTNIQSFLETGEASPAQAWNGQFMKAWDNLHEDGSSPIQPIVPEEGCQIWTDAGAVMKDAANPNAAHAFINYYLNTKVHADLTEWLVYPTTLQNESEYRDDDRLFEQPAFSPKGDMLGRMEYAKPRDSETDQYMSDAFSEIKNA